MRGFSGPGAVADAPAGVVGRGPHAGGDRIDGLGDGLGEAESGRGGQPPADQVLQEVERDAAGVCTHQDSAADPIGGIARQLGECVGVPGICVRHDARLDAAKCLLSGAGSVTVVITTEFVEVEAAPRKDNVSATRHADVSALRGGAMDGSFAHSRVAGRGGFVSIAAVDR